MNMRRLFIRRGFAALAAAAATATMGAPVAPSYGAGGPATAPAESGGTIEDHKQRSLWSRLFNKQRDKIHRDRRLKWSSWNEQHPDLVILASTSRAWRASVMHDRLKRDWSVMEALDEKIDAIWADPMDKLREHVTSWIRGDA